MYSVAIYEQIHPFASLQIASHHSLYLFHRKLSSMISRNYFRTTAKYLQSLLNLMITADL